MPPPCSNCNHSLSPILLGASLSLSPHSDGLHPSASTPELQERHRGHRRDFRRQCSVLLSIKKKIFSVREKKFLWIAFADSYSIYLPTMANSKPLMCNHWTWSRKGSTRYFSQACRTSSRDTTEDRPSETLDASLPVDVLKATRAQLPHLSYSSWPRIQGGILPLLPCPYGASRPA